jgi:hypothetical protein
MNSHVVGFKITKSPYCTPTYQVLSNVTKSKTKGHVAWEILMWKKQTNNLPK